MPIASAGAETTAEIMERGNLNPPIPAVLPPREELPYPDRNILPQNPDSPGVSSMVDGLPVREAAGARDLQSATFLAGPLAAQTLGTSFTGATLSGANPTFAFPPDSMGAVGPTQYVVAVNNRIVTFNKSTGLADGVLNATTDNFFSAIRNGSTTSDPRVRYDRLSGRWFIVIINVQTPNRILLAWTDAASAGVITGSTVWTLAWFVNGAGACIADYPTLGIDRNALYIGTNNFCSNYAGTDGYVLPKSPLLAGSGTVTRFALVTSPSAAGPYTPQGVDNYDPNAANEGYFIGVDNAFFGILSLRRVTNPGTAPTISGNISITVATTSYPKTVPHLGNTGGTNGNLDALDDRLFAAHIRNGRLWTAHNITVTAGGVSTPYTTTSGRVGVRWYELNGIRSTDNGGTPTVVQSGTLFDAVSDVNAARFFWIPSVMVSGQGHAAFGFGQAGTNFRADAATAGRWSSDSASTVQPLSTYTSSTTAYNPPSNPGGSGGRRWGDYSYVSLDPLDDMTMWTIQEFCDATNSYGVRVVKLIAPPPATPASASPSSIGAGLASVNVTITGTVVSGSGFFDPGPNIGSPALAYSHINATVTGGVIVNSVTYVSPTTVTLNLKTTGAAGGPVNVTITNPDGQSRTGTGILTIGGGQPTITCPSTVTVNTPVNASSCGTNVTFSGSSAATATGNPTPTISYAPASGSLFAVGTTAVTATATNSGGSASCSFNVVVADRTPPAINCPADINATAAANATSAVVNFSVTAGDACGSANVTSDPPSGSAFPLGTTTVTSTATDAAGNTATCSFTVTVSAATKLYLVTPCRLIDTRQPAGPAGGPSLNAGAVRNLTAVGACGIPSGTRSLAVNVTSVSATTAGWLTIYAGPSGASLPYASTLNYAAGRILANNAVIPVGPDGTINVYNSGPNLIDFIIDVSGYFK